MPENATVYRTVEEREWVEVQLQRRKGKEEIQLVKKQRAEQAVKETNQKTGVE